MSTRRLATLRALSTARLILHRAGLVVVPIVTCFPAPAAATPGAMCEHTRDCVVIDATRPEVCVADSLTSDHGHCAVLRVLQ